MRLWWFDEYSAWEWLFKCWNHTSAQYTLFLFVVSSWILWYFNCMFEFQQLCIWILQYVTLYISMLCVLCVFICSKRRRFCCFVIPFLVKALLCKRREIKSKKMNYFFYVFNPCLIQLIRINPLHWSYRKRRFWFWFSRYTVLKCKYEITVASYWYLSSDLVVIFVKA